MGCCSGFARCLLFFFNTIFWLSGAALLGLGIWILVDPDIEDYQDVIEDASKDGDFLQIGAYILVGFGAFIFLVGFCGCCGALRKSKCLLGFYIFFLVIIFAGELAAIIYVALYRSDAEDDLENGLKKSIKEHYKLSLKSAWDKIQEELDCCGGSGPDDYMNSTWEMDNKPNKIPDSCCFKKADGTAKAGCKDRSVEADYHTKGCKTAIIDWMDDNGNIVVGVAGGIAFLQLMIFICAICFCRHMDEEKFSS